MKKLANSFKYSFLFLLIVGLFAACKDDDDPVQPIEDPQSTVNDWIYETMKEVYYWTDLIPENVDKEQDPMDFFESLLYSGDRFSVIVPDYQELINSLNGITREAGYEFLLSRVSGSETQVVAIILYVKNDSPAKEAGLQRGDIITEINNIGITMSNYQSLIGAISEDHTIAYRRYNKGNDTYEDQPEVALNAIELAENPNFLDTVYTVDGTKIGYFVYNFFSNGAEGKEYDEQMDQVMADFKSQGVTEMILDLRYNSGGSISSATNLASLLGKNVDSTEVFYENKWNDLYQEYWENQPDGDDILRGKFKTKIENIGNNLSSGRLYVLTGTRSASASELVINGLNPYMDVYLIGEKTVGKNVGSIAIEDTENPNNEYGMLPIVLQTFNSEGKSDYDTGFIPNDEVIDFQLPMMQLGDVEEPLLARTMELITGTTGRMSTTSIAKEKSDYQVTPITSSIDNKLRSNRLIIEKSAGAIVSPKDKE